MRLATSPVSLIIKLFLLATVYFFTAKLTLSLASGGYASPFWPPSGIAIAAILLWGYRVIPGVFVGVVLVHWQVDQLNLNAFQIAAGNSLEAFIACYLINRFVTRRYFLNYFRQVIYFTLYVTLASALGATIGVHAITDWQSDQSLTQFIYIWNLWWLGDLVGVLVFTPLILSFARGYKVPQRSWQEYLFFLVLVGLTGATVFGGWSTVQLDNAPFAFLPMPVLVAVANRFSHRGSALTVLFLSVIAIQGTLAGFGPFVSDDVAHSSLLQQVYIICLALCGLLLCPVIHEGSRAQLALQRFSDRLEGRIERATGELVEKNSALHEKQGEQTVLIDELRTSESRYHALFENAPEAVVLFSLNTGHFVDANDNALSLFGHTREQMMTLTVADVSPPTQPNGGASNELAQAHIKRATSGEHCCFEWVHLDARGLGVHCEVRLVPFPSREDQLVRGSITVIEERIQAEARRRLTAKLFENTSEAVIIIDDQQRIIEVNDAFCRVSGYEPEEVVGQPQQLFVFDMHESAFYEAAWSVVESEGRWQGEVQGRRKNGELYPKWLTFSEVRSRDGVVTHYLGQFTDITEAKAKERSLVELATFDHLTGLHNRNSFLRNLERAAVESERTDRGFAVLFVDLDGFKRVNDSLGHDVGDKVLRIAADRLKANTRGSDLVARLGGDEFTLLIKEPHVGVDQARLARKVLAALSEPYVLEDSSLHLSASIGISRFPTDGTDYKELLRNADMAMYRAKNAGRNGYQFYTVEMKAQVQRQLSVESELRDALLNDEFLLHYQPQIELGSGRLIGVEALIRWQHPTKGLVFPGYFIDVAEQSGLICEIGNWALQEACSQARKWQLEDDMILPVAVNLSARQFQNSAELLEQVRTALDTSGLAAEMLELEITESMLMEDVNEALDTLVALRDAGIKIAIDDFGTGYSSLAYLKQFAADKLKIDRAFVRDLEHDPDDAAIVRATIALAHSLNLSVIAEGVENEAQQRYLVDAGCDQMQGYLLAKPLPPEELVEFSGRYLAQNEAFLSVDI